MLGVSVASPRLADSDPSPEKIPSGRSVVFAAELGTTPDILGMGFERNLAATDANGAAHRVYPNKVVEVAVNQYDAKFEQVDNSLLFDAHGRYLFVQAGVKASTSKRYMVVRAHQISKIVKLITEGPPTSTAPMYAAKIYYGWALYVVIEGDASTFTNDIAANLIAAGGKLGTRIKDNRLSSRVHLIGLKPKMAGDIPIAVTADDVHASFETAPDPQPILVEYSLMQDLVTDAIPWAKNEMKAGRYAVNVKLAVMDSKANGKPWDVGSPPDPLVTLIVNGKAITSCKQQDSKESTCLQDRIIDVDSSTSLFLRVVDADVTTDDPIGDTAPIEVMTSGAVPGTPLVLRTTAQLRSATLTLTPAP